MEIKLKGQVFGIDSVPSGKGSVVRVLLDFAGDLQAGKLWMDKGATLPKQGSNCIFTVKLQPAYKGFGIEGRIMGFAPAQ